ncbi:MAG: TIGR02281 family clan AA aspartic protease [Sphingobium sp.]|uniref:retropepsin-like aspartic protease family protein n=1 Tax=Sphingobium sp. TaxID=1912891 RepID=UPI0029AC334D|nr:TIGR02281 family clan AA aspartic protease [Sphingobium sp.]MDX3910532.1 TIGR02281 family clan AA aspartic protease [Sphingobium sp.]
MDGADTAGIIWYLAVLVLVGAALLSRRIQLRSAIGMILAWISIFAIVLTLVSYRDEIGFVAQRVTSDVLGRPRQLADGSRLRIAASSDGHYWVDGDVNGIPTRFLIDSGATFTALSTSTAQAASIEIDTQRMPVALSTANGPVEAQRAMVRQLAIGSIKTEDLPVVTSPAFGEVNVVGMNMLARLKSWQVRDKAMILEP